MRKHIRGFRVLMAFSFGAAPRQSTLFLLAGAMMALLMPAAAFGSKLLVDAALAHDTGKGLVAALLLTVVGALGLINTMYYVDLLFTVAERAGLAADRRLIRLMAGLPGLEHHERPEYLDKLETLREERRSLAWMTNATAGMVRVAVQLVASAILLARLNPILLLLPLAGVVSFLVGRKAQILQIKAMEGTAEEERLRRHLFDTATSPAAGKEIRSFGLVGELLDRHHATTNVLFRARNRADWQGAGLRAIDGLVSGAAYIGVIGLVLVQAVHGHATPGDVVLAVGLAAGMNAIVTIAVLYGTSFLRVLRVAERYLWLEDYAARTRQTPTQPTSIPQRLVGGIDLQDVEFRYPETGKAVLDGVSLHLPAGSVIALVGENGAGKTTLVKLLCRYYEPTRGRISVDGADIRQFEIDAWREHVAAAFQDFVRFELLARETVGIGDLPRVDDARAVETALVRAGAGDVPPRLSNGLDTQLGKNWEDGADLSGGQWQKLALGRAMMRDRPLLLILDEPTASLDAQTEHELFERYAAASRRAAADTGTITLLISHRFSTVRMADLIVVLDGGKIKELGNHQELMASGGLYAELYELQARAYR